jgi:hypothetical protein
LDNLLSYGHLHRSTRSQPEVRLMSDLPLIAFDLSETLLGLETMAPTFARYASLVFELDAEKADDIGACIRNFFSQHALQ